MCVYVCLQTWIMALSGSLCLSLSCQMSVVSQSLSEWCWMMLNDDCWLSRSLMLLLILKFLPSEQTKQHLRDNKHFESSQKLRKDGIGIWKNFIGNILTNNNLWFWLSTYTFYLYTVVYCCQQLSYDSSGQPSHCTCSLLYYAVYWYTLHARSLMNYAWVYFLPNAPGGGRILRNFGKS